MRADGLGAGRLRTPLVGSGGAAGFAAVTSGVVAAAAEEAVACSPAIFVTDEYWLS